MTFICAANWKMNLSLAEAKDFLKEFDEKVQSSQFKGHEQVKDHEKVKEHEQDLKFKLSSPFCIFPQAVHAPLFQQRQNMNWGAQDFYFETQGAFTGQNSPDIFKELGANIMLVGHSERRTLFHDDDLSISKKIKKCLELEMIPMLCVGETLDQKKSNQTLSVIHKQLHSALSKLNDSELNVSGLNVSDSNVSGLNVSKPSVSGLNIKGSNEESGNINGFTEFSNQEKSIFNKMIIAYEPVWAIGTGLTAEPKDVMLVHDFIKNLVGQSVHVLYGGSVKPENAKELSMIPSVNGFLIGGASLKVDSFLSIYNNSIKD